jgi:hypothetical protein
LTSRLHHLLLHLCLFFLSLHQFLLLCLDEFGGDTTVTPLRGKQQFPQTQHEFGGVFGSEESSELNLHLSWVEGGIFLGFEQLHDEFDNDVVFDSS